MNTHFDRLVDEFEGEFRSGSTPTIDGYLTRFTESESKELALLELISLDVYYRRSNGQTVVATDYERFGHIAVAHAEDALQEIPSATDIEKLDSPETLHDATTDAETWEAESTPLAMRIGNYVLLQQLGEGGMGTVWEAEQERPVRRRVAIKLVKQELVSKDVIARFDAEKQALAMMDHPHIAKVLDGGTTDSGCPFFVMEMVRGTPITRYCDDNKLTVSQRLQLFVQVCKAVQHAHQKGVIHRDLKPSNVLVTISDGVAGPKVIDFGLAKSVAQEMKLTDQTMVTEFGRIVGTVQYMSPEQTRLNRSDVDTRTDIYSLGVMLYELLTGATPLDKQAASDDSLLDTLKSIRETDPTRPSNRLTSSTHETNSDVTDRRSIEPGKLRQILQGELDWVVMKALEKDPDRRYQTAGDFAQDVSNYLSGRTVHARPPTTWYLVQKFTKRNRGLIVAMTAIAVLLVAGITGTSFGLLQANQKADEAETQRGLAQQKAIEANDQRIKAETHAAIATEEKEKAERHLQRAIDAEVLAMAESQRATDSEAAAKFQLANARWEAGRAFEATSLLHQIPPDYRDNFEWHYCRRLFLGSDVTYYGHTERVYKVAFSPDGLRVASAAGDGLIKIWDARTGDTLATLRGHTHHVGSVAFSPDGTRLASASFDNTIRIWDAQTYQLLRTIRGHSELVASVAFNSSGDQLVSASDDRTVKVWDVRSGEELATLVGHGAEVGCAVFSPDGSRAASACVDRTVKIWDLASAKEIATVADHAAAVIAVAFSPDGSRIASATVDTVKLWDGRSHQPLRTLKGHTQFVHHIAFSPDGSRLASAGRDKAIKLWDVRSGRAIMTLNGHTEWVNGVAFSPDGSRLASASFDRTVKLWDVRTGQPNVTLSAHAGTVLAVETSHGGSLIASAGMDSTIRLWDADSHHESATLHGHKTAVTDVAFSRDDGHMASTDRSGNVRLWNLRSKNASRSLPGHEDSANCVAFNPDGTVLATGSHDKTVKLLDIETGQELTVLKGHTGQVSSVCFSPDGESLSSVSSDGTIAIWDVGTYKKTTTLHGNSRWLTSAVFNPAGTQLAVADNHLVRIWDVDTWREVQTLRGHTEIITGLDYSPDGSRLVSASHDQTIKLWDTKNGQETTTLNVQHDRPSSVAFTADGQRLVSAGTEHTIKLWDAPSTHEVRVLHGHADPVMHVTFDATGKQIHSRSVDGTQRVWQTETGEQIDDNKEPSPERTLTTSPDGRWFVTKDGNNVLLVDQQYKNTPHELAYRNTKAVFNASWHHTQAKQAAKSRNWYAATFHYAMLVQAGHGDEQSEKALRSSYGELVGQFERSKRTIHDAYLSRTVRECLRTLQ